MRALAESGHLVMAFEIVLWAVPAVLAGRASLRSPRGERTVWWTVALACAVIVVDKAFDLQIRVYHLGQDWVRALCPAVTYGGGRPFLRLALLSALFLVGCGALYWLVRGDRSIDGAKRLSLLGLVLVMAYLGARLAPGLRDVLMPAAGRVVEIACWLLVVAGAIWARSRG
jgi:hypothetical protein